MDSKETDALTSEGLTAPQQFIDVPHDEVVEDSMGNSGTASGSGDGEQSEGFMSQIQRDSRLQGVLTVGKVMCQNASKYNPLEGISSTTQLSSKLRKEFVACADPRQYSKPLTSEEWRTRVRANMSFFRISYGVTGIFFLIYFLLTSPFLLAELLTCVGLWIYLFQIKGADDVVKIGSYELGKKEKYLIMISLTAFVAVFGGLLSYFIWVGFVSMFFICIHASFRNQIEVNPLDELADLDSGDHFV